jgi:hypothetical protein
MVSLVTARCIMTLVVLLSVAINVIWLVPLSILILFGYSCKQNNGNKTIDKIVDKSTAGK